MKEALRRWAPLLAGLFLVVIVALRLSGHGEMAELLAGLAGTTGLTDQSPVGVTEVTAAATLLVGIWLKVRSEWKKARSLK